MNAVLLTGRLIKDPEIRTLPKSNVSVANLLVEIKRFFTRSDGTSDSETSIIPCIAFDSAADYLDKNIRKNDYIAIEGELKTDVWVRDDIKRSKVKVRINHFNILPNKREESN